MIECITEIIGFTFYLFCPLIVKFVWNWIPSFVLPDALYICSPVDSSSVTVQSFWPVLAVKIVWPLSPSLTEQYFVPLGWGGRRTWRHGGVSHPEKWGGGVTVPFCAASNCQLANCPSTAWSWDGPLLSGTSCM